MKTARNFKSKTAYQKYLAYGHIHKVFENTPGNTPVKIKGQAHAVDHTVRSKKFTGKHIKSAR